MFVYTYRHTLSTGTDQGIYTQLLLNPSRPTITLLIDLGTEIHGHGLHLHQLMLQPAHYYSPIPQL